MFLSIVLPLLAAGLPAALFLVFGPAVVARFSIVLAAAAIFAVSEAWADEAELAQSGWEFLGCKVDELDDIRFCSAVSPETRGNKLPELTSRILYQCGEANGNTYETARLGIDFLNLTGGKWEGDFKHHEVRARWDKEAPVRYTFRESPSGKQLYWNPLNDSECDAIVGFQANNRLLVRLDYYRLGPTDFSYSLAGAKAAIAQAREECGLVATCEKKMAAKAAKAAKAAEERNAAAAKRAAERTERKAAAAKAAKRAARQSLFMAAWHNDLEAVKALIKAGADVNATKNNGTTLLHYAAIYAGPEIAEMFIRAGADVNAAESTGNTPLHDAAFQDKLKITELLIKSGANINAKRQDGATPLDLARTFGSDNLVKLLIEHGAEGR